MSTSQADSRGYAQMSSEIAPGEAEANKQPTHKKYRITYFHIIAKEYYSLHYSGDINIFELKVCFFCLLLKLGEKNKKIRKKIKTNY